MEKTISQLIEGIIEVHSGLNIACSPSGYNANVLRVPEKKCKECGNTIEYRENVVGLGETPKDALYNLYQELKLT